MWEAAAATDVGVTSPEAASGPRSNAVAMSKAPIIMLQGVDKVQADPESDLALGAIERVNYLD